jgi:hypothetical protein
MQANALFLDFFLYSPNIPQLDEFSSRCNKVLIEISIE